MPKESQSGVPHIRKFRTGKDKPAKPENQQKSSKLSFNQRKIEKSQGSICPSQKKTIPVKQPILAEYHKILTIKSQKQNFNFQKRRPRQQSKHSTKQKLTPRNSTGIPQQKETQNHSEDPKIPDSCKAILHLPD
jgi:hypothetical protein